MLDYRLRYLEHLTDTDMAALARIEGSTAPDELRRELASQPELIDEILGHPGMLDVVVGHGPQGGIEPGVSPFLIFCAYANLAARDLASATYVAEWTAPRCRLPVFDVASLREFVEVGERRYFLVELLASFTRVAVVAGGRDGRPEVKSELDLAALARAVGAMPAWRRPFGYRRLGDVALFSSGVFPDHTAAHPLRPDAREELAISAGLDEPPIAGEHDLTFIESVGAGWYRQAAKSVRQAVGAVPAFLGDVAEHFRQARRVLNYLADHHLYEMQIGLRPPVL